MRQKNREHLNNQQIVSIFFYKNHLFLKKKKCRQGRKKQRSNCPGQLHFDLGLAKIVALLVPMVLGGCHFFRFLLLYLKDYVTPAPAYTGWLPICCYI